MLALIVLAASPWVPLYAGVEWRSVDGLQVVRVSAPATLDVGSGDRRTAAECLRQGKAAAVINASMFQSDLRTSADHLHCGRLVNQRSKAPVSMGVFIDRLLRSDLEIVRAIHLDGGPEASLSFRSGTMQLDFFAGEEAVALPNVLIVR